MVVWAEQLEVVIAGIGITGRKSHHIVWQIGTTIVEECAASSFSISICHAGKDDANVRRRGQEPR
jgi:hypothetical protein